MPPLIEPVVPAGQLGETEQPVILGEGVRLRPWRLDDAAALRDAFGDEAIQRWHGRTIDTDVEAETLIRGWQHAWATEAAARWVITTPDEDVLAGQVGARTLDLAEGVAELSYWIAAPARGQGLAAQAARVLTDWLLGEVGLHRVELQHSTANPTSCAVAERAGFPAEGTRREAGLHADGWHDMHVHGRVAGDPA